MRENILGMIKESVIQGRVDNDDEGLVGGMAGLPAVRDLTEQALQQSISVKDIIVEGLTQGMQIVGQKYEAGEYFIPDMLAAAEAIGVAMNILRPHLAESDIKPKGTVVMATVEGDLHDIGKSIVCVLLQGAGYVVKDLGVDVAPEEIVSAVREKEPGFIGLSGLLTNSMTAMQEAIAAIEASGLRDRVKVLIGGPPTSEEFAREIGADAYCTDAFDTVRIVDSFQRQSEVMEK